MVKALFNRAMRHMLFLAQSHPQFSDRWDYHIRPIHYYEPLPDFQSITREQIERRREFPSIDFNWLALDHGSAVKQLWPRDCSSSSFWFYRK